MAASLFLKFIPEKFGVEVVIGTHPIPEKYYQTHIALNTWHGEKWQSLIAPTLCDETCRNEYN